MKKTLIIILTLTILIGIVVISLLYRIPKISVLTYHNIGINEEIDNCDSERPWTITVQNFKEQLEYLKKNNYKTLTIEEFYRWKKGEIDLPRKSVLITFDDGKLSNYQYAFPLLKEYNMNAVVFVVGSFVENGKDIWNGDLKDYMSQSLLEKCKEEYPNIEFCSHSYDLHEAQAIEMKSQAQLTEDLRNLKEHTLKTKYYAYPFGSYNDKMKQALKENDYSLAFCFGPGKKEYRKATRDDNDYEIPRLNYSKDTKIWKFGIRLMLPF